MSEERSPLVTNVEQTYGANDTSNTPPNSPTESILSAPLASTSILSSSTIASTTDQMLSTLPLTTRIGFGFGHIFNDLCAGVWFSYTLLFMQKALLIPGAAAGGLMMLGQVGDALATPVVGILVDKFGTKQRWHIFGTFLVFISFPMIFSICPWCSVMPRWWHITYFIIVILIFQFGWPIVQVSHLAIIPEMARTQKDRAHLTSMRYSASVIANVVVFIVTWLVLRSNRASTDSKIGPADAYRFRDISMVLTLMGICMTVCFHFSLTFGGYGQRRYQALNRRASAESRSSYRRISDAEDVEHHQQRPQAPTRERKNFFKSPRLYQNAMLYVFARLFMTTGLVYIPLWLDERLLQMSKLQEQQISVGRLPTSDSSVEHIATVPMVSFIASFVSSLLIGKLQRLLGHRVGYLLGSLLSIAGCFVVETTVSVKSSSVRLYFIAVLFGAGSSITMISSLCLIADMIGKHAEQSGFVYSAVTFADKLITGVAIVVIEVFKCEDKLRCPDYYKNVLARACGGAAALGILTLISLKFHRRRRAVRTI